MDCRVQESSSVENGQVGKGCCASKAVTLPPGCLPPDQEKQVLCFTDYRVKTKLTPREGKQMLRIPGAMHITPAPDSYMCE